MPVQRSQTILAPAMVGRESALAALVRLLEQASAGQGQCILLSGEAGLGQIRLVGGARRRAAGPHLLNLAGPCLGTEAAPKLSRFLARLERERLATELALAPLSRAETAEMLRLIFDLRRPARAEFLNLIYGLTEGNPFFIEEVLKSLVSTGDIFFALG